MECMGGMGRLVGTGVSEWPSRGIIGVARGCCQRARLKKAQKSQLEFAEARRGGMRASGDNKRRRLLAIGLCCWWLWP